MTNLISIVDDEQSVGSGQSSDWSFDRSGTTSPLGTKSLINDGSVKGVPDVRWSAVRPNGAGAKSRQSPYLWESAMNAVANFRLGRICLHVAALIADHQFKWHLAGIRRELSLALT